MVKARIGQITVALVHAKNEAVVTVTTLALTMTTVTNMSKLL